MAKKDDTAKEPMTTDAKGGTVFESPVSTTGASVVYQLDMGESLPPQTKPEK